MIWCAFDSPFVSPFVCSFVSSSCSSDSETPYQGVGDDSTKVRVHLPPFRRLSISPRPQDPHSMMATVLVLL